MELFVDQFLLRILNWVIKVLEIFYVFGVNEVVALIKLFFFFDYLSRYIKGVSLL